MPFLVRMGANAVAILLIGYLLPGLFTVDGAMAALAAAFVLGLVNAVVPGSALHAEVRRWADEILEKSPTALRFLKASFNADTESIAGIGQLSFAGLDLFLRTPEAREGVEAFASKRRPDFSPFRR